MKPKNLKILSALLIVVVVIVFGVVFSKSDAPDRYEADAGLIDSENGGDELCRAQFSACRAQCEEGFPDGAGKDLLYVDCLASCGRALDQCRSDSPLPPGNNPLGPEPGVVDPNF